MNVLFLDLDGTIRESKFGKFIDSPTEQQPIPGMQEAVRLFSGAGYRIIGVTNQGGVEAGHKSISDCIEEQKITLDLFPEINTIHFCPDFAGNKLGTVYRQDNFTGSTKRFYKHFVQSKIAYENIFSTRLPSFRKPQPGMILVPLLQFANSASVDVSNCWMVGDRSEDEQAAYAAGVNFLSAEMLHYYFNRGDLGKVSLPLDIEVKFANLPQKAYSFLLSSGE